VAKGWSAPDDYPGDDAAGRVSDARMDFLLSIMMPDLRAFLAGEEHPSVSVGEVTIAGFTSADGVPVSNGVFNLFVDGDGRKSAPRSTAERCHRC
jgi:hypothetical protein